MTDQELRDLYSSISAKNPNKRSLEFVSTAMDLLEKVHIEICLTLVKQAARLDIKWKPLLALFYDRQISQYL